MAVNSLSSIGIRRITPARHGASRHKIAGKAGSGQWPAMTKTLIGDETGQNDRHVKV
jgi:hypothetical protein